MGKWGRFTGVSEQVPNTAPLGSAFLLHNYVLGESSQTGIINLAPWVNCGYPYAPWHYTHNFVHVGMYLVVPWPSLIAPDAGGLGLIPGQGTRSHKPQIRVCMSRLKIAHATLKTEDPPAAKTQCSQVHFFFFFVHAEYLKEFLITDVKLACIEYPVRLLNHIHQSPAKRIWESLLE